jgi:hypothetical protein
MDQEEGFVGFMPENTEGEENDEAHRNRGLWYSQLMKLSQEEMNKPQRQGTTMTLSTQESRTPLEKVSDVEYVGFRSLQSPAA